MSYCSLIKNAREVERVFYRYIMLLQVWCPYLVIVFKLSSTGSFDNLMKSKNPVLSEVANTQTGRCLLDSSRNEIHECLVEITIFYPASLGNK